MLLRVVFSMLAAAVVFFGMGQLELANTRELELVVGRLIAVERVDASACADDRDDGRCAFEPLKRALALLEGHLDYFRCRQATRLPNIRVLPEYRTMTRHDPGPVVMVEASEIVCDSDPRIELARVDRTELDEACSRLTWKCDLVWIPAYDETIAFVGRRRDLTP